MNLQENSEITPERATMNTNLHETSRENESHFSRGLRLHRMGQLQDALACYELALKESFRHDILLNMGALLHDLELHTEALHVYGRALELAPDSAPTYHNRANTLLALNQCEEAIQDYQRAAELIPDNPEPLVPMGMAFERLLRHDEAMICYDAALRRDPNCAEAHWNRALLHLKLGRYEEGWEEFEWRWKKRGYTTASRDFGVPAWSGEPLEQQTILVHAEQAFGDTIQFARYLPLVAERCGRLILEVPLPLCELLRTVSGVSDVLPVGSPLPPCDRHVPLMSLPGVFGTTMKTIPRTVPYLSPPSERIKAWQKLLEPYSTFKAGVVWAGRKVPDPLRSCQLTDLAPLASIRGITFFSLQMDDAASQFASPPPGMACVDLTAHIHDFADTATFIAQLDLVITIDTSVAHLSGALGKPTIVLLPYVADWRWMLNCCDSPWYPTMRLFRQSTRGDWREPIQKMVAAIEESLTESGRHAHSRDTNVPPVVMENYHRGVALLDGQRFKEAHALLSQAVQESPRWSPPLVALGLCCYHQGSAAQAEERFRQAIGYDENSVDAYRCLGLLLNEQERYKEATFLFATALSLAPNDCDLRRFLGDAHFGLGNYADAAHWYSNALSRRPADVEVLLNLGAASELLNRFDVAEYSLLKAIELSPRDYRAYLNMGGVFLSQNRLEQAERYFQKALECKPNDPTVRWNLAQVSLIRGNYLKGFEEFETRFDKKYPVRVDLCGLPLWDGSSLSGKTLLVVTEQAFGDALQFCRFLPLLAQQGGRIFLRNSLKPLETLLATLPFLERMVHPGEPVPHCDWAVPMMSIPRFLGTTLESVPIKIPYLFPDSGRCSWWREYLRNDPGFKVGIAWKGRSKPDPRRSADTHCFSLLQDIRGVSWYSLQVTERGEQQPTLPTGITLRDSAHLLKDFSDTAALMSQLDLVISIDSAVAHLAGSLGRPTWLLLPFSPDWRWMLERFDSPWYPTMRLFRQPSPGAWHAVFSDLASALRQVLTTQQRNC